MSVTLEPPLPDEQRRSNGTPDGPDGSGDADGGNETETKIRGIRGEARQLIYGASCFCLSLRSLKSIVSEEICGRFGSFDGSSSSYRASSDGPLLVFSDNLVSASLFGRLLVNFVN